jgi:hypothetical protein
MFYFKKKCMNRIWATIAFIPLFLTAPRINGQPACYQDKRIPGHESKEGPALVSFNGKVYMVHVGNTSNDLWYSSYNGNQWTSDSRIPNQESKATPALAVHNGTLYMVHLGATSNDLWYSSFNGNSWTPNVKIPGQQSKTTPALASYGDKLHMVHLGNSSNDLWHSTFNGNSWSANARVPNQQSKSAPSLVAYGDKLHMVHLGNSSNDIWHSDYDGNRWSPNERLNGPKSNDAPVLIVFSGNLGMVHTGDESDDLWFSSFAGTSYTRDTKLEGRSSKGSPAAAALIPSDTNAQLHIVHVGRTSNYLWHGTMPVPPKQPVIQHIDNIGKRSATIHWQDNSSSEETFAIQRRRAKTDFETIYVERVGCPPAGRSTGQQYQKETYAMIPDRYYEYRVCAVNFGGMRCSDPKSINTLPPEYPAAPSDLEIKEVTGTTISIGWADNSDNETGFKVYWKRDADIDPDGTKKINENNVSSFKITNLHQGWEYCITVLAFNEDGESQPTRNKCARTKDAQPPQVGYSQISISNCHQLKKTIRVWTLDQTGGSEWVDRGEIAPQYSQSGTCPVGNPLKFSLEEGHVYTVVGIDCGDESPDKVQGTCWKLQDGPVTGRAGGPVRAILVN